MDDVGRMHVQEASENLVDEILNVVVGQVLARVNDSVQVGLHQFGNYVNVSVACAGLGLEQVNQPYDILVLKKFFFIEKST